MHIVAGKKEDQKYVFLPKKYPFPAPNGKHWQTGATSPTGEGSGEGK